MILILFLYLLFASTFTLGKAALFYIPPILFVGIRMIIAGIILLAGQYFFHRPQWRFDWRDVSSFFHIALFLIFIAFVGEFWALQYVTASKTALLYSMSPFITALFAYLLLREQLTPKQWLGLGIGFIGFLPILTNQGSAEIVTKHIWFLSMPELLLLISVVSSCYGWIVMKYLVVQRDYSPIMVNGIGMLGGGVMAFCSSLLIEGKPHIFVNNQPLIFTPFIYSLGIVIFYTGALILIANVICFNLYSHLLRRYSATFISFAGFTTPIFAAFLDLIFLNERIPLAFYLTMGMVFIGLWIFYQDELLVENK